jgi:putative transcriptional regulator
MLSFLHSDSFLPGANVMPNVNLGHSVDTLVEITEGYSPARQMKVFAGYAGWSPGQLEDEMKRDTWLTHPPTLDLIFTSSPAKLWRVVLAEKGWRYKLIADAPEDLSWN